MMGKAPQTRPTAAEQALAQQEAEAQQTLDIQGATIDTQLQTLDTTIQTFNASKSEISVLKNNSGSSSQQVNYATTQVLQDKSQLPTFLLVGLALYMFFGKGK